MGFDGGHDRFRKGLRMKRFIEVHDGEIVAGQGDVVLKSDSDHACLVITAYDPNHKIGALAHAIFLSELVEKKHDPSIMQDVSHAIDEMITDMTLLGSHRSDIEVCLVTGENVQHTQDDPAYNRNIATAIEVLKEKRVRFREDTATEVGKSHVGLDVESGEIVYT